MKILKFLLLMGVGGLAIGAWARSPSDTGANAVAAQRLIEQRRADLRATLKASQNRVSASLEGHQEVLDTNPELSEDERAQRRLQLRRQISEVRYDSP